MLPLGYTIEPNLDIKSIRRFILCCPNRRKIKWKTMEAAIQHAKIDNVNRQSVKVRKILRYFKKRYPKFDFSESKSKTTNSKYYSISYNLYGNTKYLYIRISDHKRYDNQPYDFINYTNEEIDNLELKQILKTWIKNR